MKKPESILALDLGSSYVKLVEREETSVKSLSVIPIPCDLQNIKSVNEPSYINFIKKIISEKGINAKNAVVCISSLQLEIKNLVIPSMSSKELSTSINWQVKDILSIPQEEAVIDYMMQGDVQTSSGKKMELCVAGMPKKIVEEYSLLLQALGLIPLAFVLEPQSAWRVIKDCPEFKDKKTIALINMGAEKAIISVFSDNRFRLMRSLHIAGNRFTGSIAQRVLTTEGKGLDINIAESVKCKYGISASTGVTEENVNYQDIFSALRPSLEDLVFELIRFVEYYRSEHEGNGIEIIAFYGGTSLLPGLSDYISKNIGIPVVLPDLVSARAMEVSELQKEELKNSGLFLINAIGAGVIKDESMNLLPHEVKAKKKLQYEKAVWIKVWTGFLIACSVIFLSLSFIGLVKKNTLVKLKNKYEKFSMLKEELQRYNTIVYEFNSKTRLLDELVHKEPFWEDLLKELAVSVPDNIVLDKLALSPKEETAYKTFVLSFVIVGIVYPKNSPPEEDLTKFMNALEKSQYLRRIKLEYSKEGKIKEEKVLEFKIVCDIR